MGFDINLNKKVQEILTRTAGEKHDDFQISKDIEKYAAEMGISKADLEHAMMYTVWAAVNPFSGGIEGIEDTVGVTVDSQLEAARQKRISLSAPAAFGDLKADGSSSQSAVSQSGTEPSATSQVRTVQQSSDKAYSDAQDDVNSAKNKKNNAQRGLNNTRQKADNDNANAGANVTSAQNTADETEARGKADIAAANDTAKSENNEANNKYQSAQSGVETAKNDSAQAISSAEAKSTQNNKLADEELNNAKTKQSSITKTISDLETKISDSEKNLKKLNEALNSPDATEETNIEYNKAVTQKRQLEEELEKAKEESKKAAKTVSESEEKVKTTKQEGEDLINRVTEEEGAKVRTAENSAAAALTEMNETEKRGQANVTAVTENAAQNNNHALASLTAAKIEAGQVKMRGQQAVSDAEKTLAGASRQVDEEKKKAADIKAEGRNAVAAAKSEEQNPGSQSAIRTTETFAQSLINKGVDSQVTSELNNMPVSSENDNAAEEILSKLENASSSARSPFGNTPEVLIRHTAEQIAAKQGNNDELSEESSNTDYPVKRKSNTFGI